MWLGGGLWWVARRLFGNEGGFLALGLYTFCPAVVSHSVVPNNDVLAMWGLYGLVYTAIGVAHALQGPRRKWRPRIMLLTLSLGLTAAAHLLAAILGDFAALFFMLYVAEYRRSYVMQILVFATVGALAIVFAFYGFHLAAFSYVFTGGAARFWFSLDALRGFVFSQLNVPIVTSTGVAAVLLPRGKAQPILWQHCATADGARAGYSIHHADRYCPVVVVAAIPLHVYRRRLRRRTGDASTASSSSCSPALFSSPRPWNASPLSRCSRDREPPQRRSRI